jgi:hypothetical protein
MGIRLDMLFPIYHWGIVLLTRWDENNLIVLKVLHYSKFVVFMHEFDEGIEKGNKIQYDIYPLL